MPPHRTVDATLRRSRRLSQQPPRTTSDGIWEKYDYLLDAPDSPAEEKADRASLSPAPQPFTSSTPNQIRSRTLPSSHSRKNDRPGHVRRPPNAFICFRSALWNKNKAQLGKTDHRSLSCDAAVMWNALSDAEKLPYQLQAQREKEKHEKLHPGYKYTPVFRKERPQQRNSRKRGSLDAVPTLRFRSSPSPRPRPRRPKGSSKTTYPPLVKQEERALHISDVSSPEVKTSPASDSNEPDDFVPIEDIPDLHLDAMSLSDDRKPRGFMSPNFPSPQLPQHDLRRYDPIFGIRPQQAMAYEYAASSSIHYIAVNNIDRAGTPPLTDSPISPVSVPDFEDPFLAVTYDLRVRKGMPLPDCPVSPKTLLWGRESSNLPFTDLEAYGEHSPVDSSDSSFNFDDWLTFDD